MASASVSRFLLRRECRVRARHGEYQLGPFSPPRIPCQINIAFGSGFAEEPVGGREGSISVACSMPSPLVPVLRNRQVLCKAEANVPGNVPDNAPAELSQYDRIIELLTTLFPVWVILGTIIGIYKPSAVTWLETDLFTVGLGFLMLSMGLTLTFEDFRRCMRNPWTVGVGFLAQYMIKPVLGFAIAMTLKLSAPLATGLILVSCCPGGQASNVATYISKGNVALSVLMTTNKDCHDSLHNGRSGHANCAVLTVLRVPCMHHATCCGTQTANWNKFVQRYVDEWSERLE